MKSITITYLASLGSFLDEKNIRWSGTDKDNVITIYYTDEKELFYLGMEFEEFRAEIN